MNRTKDRFIGIASILLATILWGTAFVAQQTGMESIGCFTFSAVRGGIAFLVCVLLSLFLNRKNPLSREKRNRTIKNGMFLGLFLFAASNLQQAGLMYTTVAKAGFLTTLYVAFVPFIGILFHKKLKLQNIICSVIALAGMYFLCIGDDFSVNIGDLLVLGCAIAYAFHILFIDRLSDGCDTLLMNGVQFLIAGIISIVPALLFEDITLSGIGNAMIPLLYAGVLSAGVAFSLQIYGQRFLEPAIAGLFMCFESVFAALAGWIILGQSLSGRELFGCALVFCAAILSQVFEIYSSRKTNITSN